MGGENGWGCGRATHHQAAPLHPQVCFVQASPPKQRSGSWKSCKHPVMGSTRSRQHSNFLHALLPRKLRVLLAFSCEVNF